jgi:hypothetical protein
MKNPKNTLAAITMMAVLAFGTTFANAGIIIAGLKDDGGKTRTTQKETTADPCGEPSSESGIIIAGLAGIIIAGYTGIIIAGAKDEAPVNCGIIIAG